MQCELYIKELVNAFNSFWQCEQIDASTAKITFPYISLNNKFADVYIKKQGKDLIISDGGYLNEFLTSGELGNPDTLLFQNIINTYIDEYEISIKSMSDKRSIYFMKVENEEMLLSKVFEMAEFCKSYLSAIHIASQNQEVEAAENAEQFKIIGQGFIKSSYGKKYQITYNENITYQGGKKKVHALIYYENKLNPIQFLGGGSFWYYKSNINNTNEDFRLISQNEFIGNKIAFYDNESEVFNENKSELSDYLGSLREQLTQDVIPWSDKEKLYKAIPQ